MLSLNGLAISNFTIAMLVVWCLVSIRNKNALIMVACLIIYTLVQAISPYNFPDFLTTSVLFLIASVSNINLSSQFRKAFLCFGLVYFIGAVDQAIYYHIEVNAYFDVIQPYIITAINAYLLAHLLSDGGKQGANSYGVRATTFCRRIFRLSLRKTG